MTSRSPDTIIDSIHRFNLKMMLYTAPHLIAYSKGKMLTLKLSTTLKPVNRCVCMRNDLCRFV